MYRLISWYNQNRRKIWITIFTVIIIWILVLWILNRLNDSLQGSTNAQQKYERIDTNSLNSITLDDNSSAVTGNNNVVTQEEITLIDTFISYCNSGKIEEAYNMISDDCKEEMYPELNNFKEAYFIPVFGNGKKNVSVINWIGNIYKVDFIEDYLSTGKYSQEKNIQDYISIVEDKDNNNKLNINKYIRKETVNKETNQDGISIRITEKDVYMDYEYYTFEIANTTDKSISLGDISFIDASYLVDANELRYNAYVSELSQAEMVCSSMHKKRVKIKYFNQFSSSRKIEGLVFPKVILDYDVYSNIENKTLFSNYKQIFIDL